MIGLDGDDLGRLWSLGLRVKGLGFRVKVSFSFRV